MKNKQPLFLLVNDIHLTKDNCDLVYNIFEQVISFCRKNKVNNVVIGGDMFTNRSGQPLSVLLACLRCFNLLSVNDIELFIIPGNHDKTDANADESYLDVFRNCDGVTIIRREKIITLNNCDIYFIPYYGREVWLERFEKLMKRRAAIEDYAAKRKRILITHVAIDGVRNNDGSIVSGEIDGDKFDWFDEVFVGHYHNASDIGKNIHYTGSAYQKDYGEDIDKGFTIVYNDATWEKINSDFPRYIKEVVQADDVQGLRNVLEKYEGVEDNVRIVIRGSKVDCEKINVNDIRLKYGVDVKVQTDEELEAMEVSQNDTIQFDKVSIKKDFIRFCADNGIKGDKFKFGLDLIKGI